MFAFWGGQESSLSPYVCLLVLHGLLVAGIERAETFDVSAILQKIRIGLPYESSDHRAPWFHRRSDGALGAESGP
jgi:hypothetical protein